MCYRVMQELVNNKTHGFVVKLEGVFVGASETPHIF